MRIPFSTGTSRSTARHYRRKLPPWQLMRFQGPVIGWCRGRERAAGAAPLRGSFAVQKAELRCRGRHGTHPLTGSIHGSCLSKSFQKAAAGGRHVLDYRTVWSESAGRAGTGEEAGAAGCSRACASGAARVGRGLFSRSLRVTAPRRPGCRISPDEARGPEII
jgi:hypothetical protein